MKKEKKKTTARVKSSNRKVERKKKKVSVKKKSVRKKIISKKPTVTKKEEPVEKTPEERKANLKRFLLKMREDVLQEAKKEIAKYIKGETKQIIETALDDGDWSVADLAEDISLKQLSTHRENLLKIDEALRKVDENTYGICEECGEEIPEERLRIMPFAIYCLDCQEKKEMLEKLEREIE